MIALIDRLPASVVGPDRVADAARRVMQRCEELAAVSAASDAIQRVYLSREHAEGNALAAGWMREIGMTTWQDAAGNQIGRLDAAGGTGVDREAPALVLGSHLDTVPDAGRYDGIVGVLMAIEIVRMLRVPLDDGGWASPFPFALEVVAFADEEGTRFGTALLGSSAVAGAWKDDWWALTDAEGTTLREAFHAFGLDPERIGEAERRSSSWDTSKRTSSRALSSTIAGRPSPSCRRSRAHGASSSRWRVRPGTRAARRTRCVGMRCSARARPRSRWSGCVGPSTT